MSRGNSGASRKHPGVPFYYAKATPDEEKAGGHARAWPLRSIDIGQVKDVYRASDKSDAAKKTAKDSLRAIHDKYNAQIGTILSPEQSKGWKRMQRDWKEDLSMPKS